MKLILPSLVVFAIADSFLKQYVFASAISEDPLFPYLMVVAFLALLLTGCKLFLHFRRNATGLRIWDRLLDTTVSSRSDGLIAATIILAGVFLRFWQLDGLYDGVWYDEAYKGLDAISIRAMGERPFFLDWNGPREPLVAYLVTAFSYLFGDSVFSVRAVEAVAGSLTLVSFYLLSRRLFHRHLALLSLFFLAFSKYHLIFSRMGFRVNLFPLFEVASLYFLVRGFETNRDKVFSFVLAGLTAGMGFYTYISYRIFPLVLLAFLLDAGVRRRLREHIRGLIAGGLVFLVTVAPLTLFFLKNPHNFTARMESVSIWNESEVSLPGSLLQNASSNVAMFTFRGDPRVRHNVRKEPALSPFITAFFLIGCLLVLSNVRRPYAFFLIFYLFISLIPGVLSIHGPHFARNLGALPPALIICAAGMLAAARLVVIPKLLRNSCAMIILGGVFLTGAMDAMVRYPFYLDRPERLSSGMNWLETNVARQVQSLGKGCQAYVSPQLFFHATVEYLAYPEFQQKLFTKETALDPKKVAVVFLLTEKRDLWWLKDSDQMDYFKWWREYRGMGTESIRDIVNSTYGLSYSVTKYSDRELLEELRRKHPGGKEMKLGPGTIYLVPKP